VLAFSAGGYFEGPRLIAAIVAWALVVVVAIAVPHADLPRGRAALLALGGLLALTLWAHWSRSWAPLAGPAGDEVQRDALYLGALTAGALAWRPRAWARAVEPALALGVLVVLGYGLSGRLLPGIIQMTHQFSAGGRIDQPLTYWNAEGALAAIGFVLCARIAGDRTRRDALRVLAAAAAVPLAVALYLAYSRGAFAAVAAGLLVLCLLAPTWPQLRAIAVCVEAGAVAAVVASRLDGFASLSGALRHREAHGVLMLSILVALMIVAAAVQAWGCRVEAQGLTRLGPLPLRRGVRTAGWLAALAVAAFPYAAALREKGTGDVNPAFGANVVRLGSIGSHRYAYWRVAGRTFLHHPLRGTGAGSFRVQWLRERPFNEAVRDAHSLYLQTAAELGLIGLLALGALFAGVLLAARRTWLCDPALAAGPIAALAVFALHAGVDWDWQMPALTLVAITLAGLLLARSAAT